MMTFRSLLFAGVVMELCYLSFYLVLPSPFEVAWFMGMNAVTFGALSFLVYRLRRPPLESHNKKKKLLLIVFAALVFRLTLVMHAPVASDDIYRYLWDGRVAAHGINPFAFAPADSALSHLQTVDLPARVGFPRMRTIYPPLAQMFFLVSNICFGESTAGMKLLLVLMDGCSIILLILLLKQFAMNPTTVVLYAWSPLPVLYLGLDGHIDALGIPFLLLFILLMSQNRRIAGAVSLGLAGLVKLYPLFVVPMLLNMATGWKKFMLAAIPLVMLVTGYALYVEPSGGFYESFLTLNTRWEFNGSIFEILYLILRSNEQAHLASGLLFVCWLGWVFFAERSLLEKTFLAFLGFILFAPVVHPWYLIWLAALSVLRWSLAVFVLLGLSTLSTVVVYLYHVNGVWQDQPWMLLIEYLPVYALFLFHGMRKRFQT